MQPEIKEVLVLRVQPGDAIILKIARAMSAVEVHHLKTKWLECFSGSAIREAPLVILADDSDIAVLRHADESADLTKIARETFKTQTGCS